MIKTLSKRNLKEKNKNKEKKETNKSNASLLLLKRHPRYTTLSVTQKPLLLFVVFLLQTQTETKTLKRLGHLLKSGNLFFIETTKTQD